MNKNRRKRIEEVIDKLRDCSESLSSIKGEEDESRDNIPEGLQESDVYRFSEECSDKMDDAISNIEDIICDLEEI